MNVGDRVKLTPRYTRDCAGLIGVIVRKTSGHYGCNVWLDKPYTYLAQTRGYSRVRQTIHCISMNEADLSLTDEIERFYTRPTWKVILKTLYRDMQNHSVEVVDSESGEVVATMRGVRAASQRAERLRLQVKMRERKETRSEAR